jgi:predicted acyl esterase
MTGNLEWGSSFFSIMGRAPDPLIVGAKWREMWQARLAAVRPYYAEWLRHQRRDDYWRHGSVAEDIGAITCAVLAVGGWLLQRRLPPSPQPQEPEARHHRALGP